MKFLLVVFCFTFSFLAFGAGAGSETLQKIAEYLAPILASFALSYPKLAMLSAIMVGSRIIMKPLMPLLWAIADMTKFTWDNELLKKVENHVVYKFFCFFVDQIVSVKLKNPKK